MIADTSLDAYYALTIADLQRKEREVLNVFIRAPGMSITRELLAMQLGWKEASVCGRANSLVCKGVLEEIEGGRTKSGRSAKLLRLPIMAQKELF